MVAFSAWVLPILGCVPHVFAAPSEPRALSYKSYPDRTAAVKEAFNRAWTGYETYALPNDNLLPITKSYVDDLSVIPPPRVVAPRLILKTEAVGAQVR